MLLQGHEAYCLNRNVEKYSMLLSVFVSFAYLSNIQDDR